MSISPYPFSTAGLTKSVLYPEPTLPMKSINNHFTKKDRDEELRTQAKQIDNCFFNANMKGGNKLVASSTTSKYGHGFPKPPEGDNPAMYIDACKVPCISEPKKFRPGQGIA